jgi:hypothetical protein
MIRDSANMARSSAASRKTHLSKKAGLQESDVILAINGAKVRYAEQISKAVEKNGPAVSTFTIYRGGEVIEKSVTPGVERYQNIRTVAFAITWGTRFDVDIFPNPDFSLVAIGLQKKRDRLDLRDAKSKYLKELAEAQGHPQTEEGWQGAPSQEGWKFWIGPIWVTKNRSILSQE